MKNMLLSIIIALMLLTGCSTGNVDIITHFNTGASGSYPTPEPGQIVQTGEIQAAREHYRDKDVKYLVYLRVYDENGKPEESEEYKRLSSLGYSLCRAKMWTYSGTDGKKSYYDAVLILLSEAELEAFPVSERYGYFFTFIYNGDHSPVDLKNIKKL